MNNTFLNSKTFICIILLCVFSLSGYLKIHLHGEIPGFNPHDDTALYWTESAVHYRYAKMIAEGEPLPDVDHKLQWPEGVEVRKDLTILMEYAAGYTYRLFQPIFPDTPFHVFLISFVSFFSSLTIFPIFLIARKVNHSVGAGLFAGVLYGISLPAIQRVIGNYGREDFAIPLLFASIYFFLNVIDNEITRQPALFWANALLMGAFQFAALAGWHFSRFFYLTFVSFFVLAYLVNNASRQRFKNYEPMLFRGLTVFTATSVLAGLTLPVLRSRQFIFSLPLLISYMLILGYPLRKRIPTKTHTAMTLACVGLMIILKGILFPSPEDTHVYGIFFYKLKHLLLKPADPKLLPFEVRSIWLENGNTPHLREILYLFGGQLLILILSLVPLIRKEDRLGKTLPKIFLLYFTGLYLVLYVMVTRTSPLLAVFLAIACGSAIPAIRQFRKKRTAAVALALLFCLEAYQTVNIATGTYLNAILYRIFPEKYPDLPSWGSNNLAVVEWFRRKSPENDPVLARFATGPMILAYTNHPIILQPKYETRQIRKKVEAYYQALFGSEKDFYGYCTKYGANYFLYESITALQFSPDSERYLADKIKLPSDSAVYTFQFRPKGLHYFTLEYQNTNFRIYKIHPYEGQIDGNTNVPYQPVYDIRKFQGNAPSDKYFNDTGTYDLYKEVMMGWQWFQRGKIEFNRRNFGKAQEAFIRAHRLNPGIARLNMYLGLNYLARGDHEKALKYCLEEIKVSPFLPSAYYNLGGVYVETRRYKEALQMWKKTEELDPGYQDIREKIHELKNSPAPLSGHQYKRGKATE